MQEYIFKQRILVNILHRYTMVQQTMFKTAKHRNSSNTLFKRNDFSIILFKMNSKGVFFGGHKPVRAKQKCLKLYL